MERGTPDIASLVQRHGRSLRRLAFELVHDGAEVDDALQATWLQVLRHPPAREAHAHGWLATVLRHVVFRSRRGERRRTAREQAVARDPVAADPAEFVAQAEIAERVLAAVRSLDEPYRTTVWQRFFEDLPPSVIAARGGVPVATVKSRLQRGLQQLRERLGEGGESSDWRCALALAFGFEMPKGAAAAGTAFAVTGGVTMALWTKIAAAVAVAVAVAVWSSWPTAAAKPEADAGAPVLPTVGAESARQEAISAGAAPDRVLARGVDVAAEAPDRPTATVHGRCVDLAGAPLAECVVRIEGGPIVAQMDTWLRDHADPDWHDLEQATGADGRFSFTFWPPPPIAFTMRIERRGSGPLGGSLRIEPGATVDAGDVTIQPGIQLVGRVIDAEGRTVPGVEIEVQERGVRPSFDFGTDGARRPGVGLAPKTTGTRSDAGGTFRLPELLAPASYGIRLVYGSSRRDPHTVDLRADRPIEDVTLVSSVSADAPTIRGRVVDADGIGLRNAHVGIPANRTGPAIRAVSGADGSFCVWRQGGDPDPVSFAVVLPGHAEVAAPPPIAWGAVDATLVLHRGGDLQVRVVDEHDRPVANYTVRAMPRHDGRRRSGETPHVRARGPFTNGLATVPGITEGSWKIAIEFPTAAGLVTHVQEVACDGHGGRIDVRAESTQERTLRVVTADGAPVAGTRVEVLDHVQGVFDTDTNACPLPDFLRRSGGFSFGLLVASGTTAADGTFLLRGATSRLQALRLLGPGHVAVCDAAVDLGAPGDLVVEVHRGARLIAHLVPPTGLDELRRRAGLAPGAAFAEGKQPSLQVSRDIEGAIEERVPTDGNGRVARLDADNRCELAAIPPGTWRVGVAHWRILTGSIASRDRIDLTEVTLADGTTTEITLDLTPLLPGTLEGLVLHNGLPLAEQEVSLRRAGDEGDRGTATTDADGRLVYQGLPGSYSLSFWRPTEHGSGPTLLSPDRAEVFVGQTTRQTFLLSSGTLQVTLVDESGSPAVGVKLWSPDASQAGCWLAPTDGSGHVTTPMTTGTVTLQVLPERLSSPDAQAAVRKQAGAGAADPLGPHRLTLGTVTVQANETTAVELRLPPEWRQ